MFFQESTVKLRGCESTNPMSGPILSQLRWMLNVLSGPMLQQVPSTASHVLFLLWMESKTLRKMIVNIVTSVDGCPIINHDAETQCKYE